jgi:hypothetical protein
MKLIPTILSYILVVKFYKDAKGAKRYRMILWNPIAWLLLFAVATFTAIGYAGAMGYKTMLHVVKDALAAQKGPKTG